MIKVNDEGIKILKDFSQSIREALPEITTEIQNVNTVYEDNKDYLGPHSESIEAVINDIEGAVKTAEAPVEAIAEILDEVAECYQEIIDINTYGSGK